ncbi:hypothetical protein [Streptomyces sp. NPDC020983]|uniref:hypothetical protein n=1 Tax=Streptomyces sp. NPDC020983 TaxID=3365106 RepID=UPI00379C8C06
MSEANGPGDEQTEGEQRAHAVARAELDAFIAECEVQENKHASRARRWEWIRVILGLPAVVLATIAGATGLSSSGARVPAALCALISGCLVSVSTFLRPDARNVSATERKRAYRLLRTEARLAAIRMETSDIADPIRMLEDLQERRRMIITGRLDQLLTE